MHTAQRALVFQPPNGTLAKLQAASRTDCDAARQLPRLTIALAEAIGNCRDAVANVSAEALQRRANASAVCQLQLVVSPPSDQEVSAERRVPTDTLSGLD